MAFQILAVATRRLVKRRTGSTPGRLFQISISRDHGHFSASAASSCGLLNVSPLFSSFCWRRLILFSALILKAVLELLCEGFPHHDSHGSGRRKQVLSSQ